MNRLRQESVLRAWALLGAALLLAACGHPATSSHDAGAQDAGQLDAGQLNPSASDAGEHDAGAYDAGDLDAGVVDAGEVDAGALDAGELDAGPLDAGELDAGTLDAGAIDAGLDAGPLDAGPLDAGCISVGTTPVALVAIPTSDEYELDLTAKSASHTDWAAPGNEAVVLDVSDGSRTLGQIVMHQGADAFTYKFDLGAQSAGASISVAVSSTLSAAHATQRACVWPPQVISATQLGAKAAGLLNAPIIKWPVEKRFDDLPVMLGWSNTREAYELYYTNENGGTTAQCGGGATGIQAEIARWGRASDDETIFHYSGGKTWERCDNTSESYASITPRQEALHPVLYYGDGHNRLFESRGGYGQTCGTSSDTMADGYLNGWNSNNPGNAESLDGPYVITMRLVPVGLDALGYGRYHGRREGALDHDAPWMYRITAKELQRENKIDGSHSLPMDQYLYADVKADDVNGSGDQYCSTFGVSGGFKLRAVTRDGVTHDGPQMTSDYFTGSGVGWKRIAIPMNGAYAASDVTSFIFDAYDSDGIYFLALGDAFIPNASGDDGAKLDYVRQGTKSVNVYVDDNNSGCVNGFNYGGPSDAGYPCEGSAYQLSP